MKNLLFLVHRIPYPPNKGDKIRSYNFLKGLSSQYNIYLATFIDEPRDREYIRQVKALTVKSLFIDLNTNTAKFKSLLGFLTNKPLSLPYYRSSKMQRWVDSTVAHDSIDKIFVYSSAMSQYIDQYVHLDVIVDFVDVDSDKWLQYSKKAKWPMSWIYRREARLLFAFDSQIASLMQMSTFVSEQESLLFSRLLGKDKEKITYVNNGVDIVFFDPYESYVSPYIEETSVIVFTGAMDYWANVDAAVWFVNGVFPLIKQYNSAAKFYIVGSNPTKEVLQLATEEGVLVTGRVEDIRPYISFANVVVTPLLIARGIQNKILEAMAMGKRIVSTSQAIEGIAIDNQEVQVIDDKNDFARQVISYLENTESTYCSERNRNFVAKNYSWNASLKRLVNIIENNLK